MLVNQVYTGVHCEGLHQRLWQSQETISLCHFDSTELKTEVYDSRS